VDKTTLPGLILAFVCILVAVILDGGNPLALIGIPAGLLVFGGTLSVGLLITPMPTFLGMPKVMLKAILDKPQNILESVENFVRLADRARKEGLLALEQEAATLDSFTRRGIMMVVDGNDPHLVREVMETEVAAMQRRHKASYSVFESMGAYAPTIGIVGTTTGLIRVLGNLSDPESLGEAIAAAFIATLYGVASANIFFLPLAQKLKTKSADEVWLRELQIEGVMAVQAGDNPRMVREKLEAQLAPASRSDAKASAAAAQSAAA
jgi:chemotaxis protein MotA